MIKVTILKNIETSFAYIKEGNVKEEMQGIIDNFESFDDIKSITIEQLD